MALGVGDSILPKMKIEATKTASARPRRKRLDQMIEIPGAARCDYRHRTSALMASQEFEVVTVLSTVAIHARDQQLPCAHLGCRFAQIIASRSADFRPP